MSISEIHKKYAALSAARGTAIGPAPGAQLSGAAAENQAPSRSRPPSPETSPTRQSRGRVYAENQAPGRSPTPM